MALSSQTRAVLALIVGAGALAMTLREQKQRAAQEAAQQAREQKAEQAAQAPKGPAAQVIALWTGVPVPGEPLGLHVADVSVDPAGAVSLVLSDNTTTKAKVEAAIAQMKLQPALPVPAPAVSTAAAPSAAPTAAFPASARPGDPRYAAAVAQFLGAQTGFKPQLEGSR